MKLWQILMTPDNFERSPYGELTNQMGHTLGGAIAAISFCLLYDAAMGEMPYRWLVLLVCGWPYVVFVEVWRQGWKAGDAWFDSLMWICGVMGPLSALRETQPGLLEATPLSFFALLFFWAFVLLWRVKNRM